MRLPRPCLIAALVVAASPAPAAPLEPPACKVLKSEHESLIAAGAKRDMAKGPEWALKNLTADRLEKIARLIAVEEDLSFRCEQLVTARPQMTEPPEEPGQTAGKKRRSTLPLPIKKSEHMASKAGKKK